MMAKLLTRLLSEEGKLVYAALQKWTASPNYRSKEYFVDEAIDRAFDRMMAHGTFRDKFVLSREFARVKRNARGILARREAAEMSAQILMGEVKGEREDL